jgi:chromosome partitioning protein
LLVDLDPQGNATMGSGVDKRQLALSVYDVLLESASIQEAAIYADKSGYHVLGANRELAGAEVELVDLERRDQRLKLAIHAVDAQFDFVLIDCPPSLSMLTLNGLCAAHGVIVPMQCEFYALEGLSQLMKTIELVRRRINPSLHVAKVLLTMVDSRNRLTQQVAEEVRKFFGSKVCETVIPRNVRLSEAPGFGEPAISLYPGSKGAMAYHEFVKEVQQTCAVR